MMFLSTAWCTEAANDPGQPPSEGKRQQQKEFEDMSDAEQQVLDVVDESHYIKSAGPFVSS